MCICSGFAGEESPNQPAEQLGSRLAPNRGRDASTGREIDVSDAQWLQRLHSFGLLRARFRLKGQTAGAISVSFSSNRSCEGTPARIPRSRGYSAELVRMYDECLRDGQRYRKLWHHHCSYLYQPTKSSPSPDRAVIVPFHASADNPVRCCGTLRRDKRFPVSFSSCCRTSRRDHAQCMVSSWAMCGSRQTCAAEVSRQQ